MESLLKWVIRLLKQVDLCHLIGKFIALMTKTTGTMDNLFQEQHGQEIFQMSLCAEGPGPLRNTYLKLS